MSLLKAIIRYIVFIGVSFSVTVGLWLLMNTMIASGGKSGDSLEDAGRVEFIRLKRTSPPKFKEREVPQKPPPPKKPPPPPQLSVADVDEPQQEAMNMDMPNIEMPLSGTGGSGAYIGEYHSTATQSQSRDRIPKFRVEPVYPRKALLEGLEGYVRLLIDITDEGTVANIRLVETEPDRIFVSSAIRAVYKWRYAPEIVEGKAVEVKDVPVELTFALGEE